MSPRYHGEISKKNMINTVCSSTFPYRLENSNEYILTYKNGTRNRRSYVFDRFCGVLGMMIGADRVRTTLRNTIISLPTSVTVAVVCFFDFFVELFLLFFFVV